MSHSFLRRSSRRPRLAAARPRAARPPRLAPEPLERRVLLSATIYEQPDGFAGDGWSQGRFDGLVGPVTLLRQPDGKLLAAAEAVLYDRAPDGSLLPSGGYDFTAVRFNEDGTLDATFGGGDGVADVDLGFFTEHTSDLALLPDGRIILVGTVFGERSKGEPGMGTAVIRLHPDGSLDTTFGQAGMVHDHTGTDTGIRLGECVAIDAQGRILVGGNTRVPGEPEGSSAGKTDGLVARYLPDGSRDASFGENGVVRVAGGPGWGRVQDVAPLPDGDVLVSSAIQTTDKVSRDAAGTGFHLTRLDDNGSRDVAFGQGGQVRTQVAGLTPEKMAVLPDGSIVVGGSVTNGWEDDDHLHPHPGVLARYTPAGALDPAFGGAGTGMHDITEAVAPRFNFGGLAVAPDGKLLVSGSHVARGPDGAIPSDWARRDYDASVMRFNPDGTPDPTFGPGGVRTIETGVAIGARAVAALPDGSSVAAGYFRQPRAGLGTFLARFGPAGEPPAAPPDEHEEPRPPPPPPPPPMPDEPKRYPAPFTRTVGGFVVEYTVREIMGMRLPELTVRARDAADPAAAARDDVVTVAQNPTLPLAVDFVLNGETFTADFSKLGPRTNWTLDAGGGNDRVAVTFPADAPRANAFSGYAVAGGPGNDELSNGDTNGGLSGGPGDDTLRGGAAQDLLWGDKGIDQLYGNGGNDLLQVGTLGVPWVAGEVYDGGPGDDWFVLNLNHQPLPDDGPVGEPSPAPPPPPPGAAEPPKTMSAAYVGKGVARKGRTFHFKLVYAAAGGGRVDVTDVRHDDVTVTGPGGTTNAILLGARSVRRGNALVARYRVDAPGGVFDASDNGAYTIRFGRNTVAPAAAPPPGQFQRLVVPPTVSADSVAQHLATFTVDVKGKRKP